MDETNCSTFDDYLRAIENQDANVVTMLDPKINKADLEFKVIIIGNTDVGKSSLIKQVIHNKFERKKTPTIGFEYLTMNGIYNNQRIRLQMWDTCGQEAFASMIKSFFRNASLAMISYSITEYISLYYLVIVNI